MAEKKSRTPPTGVPRIPTPPVGAPFARAPTPRPLPPPPVEAEPPAASLDDDTGVVHLERLGAIPGGEEILAALTERIVARITPHPRTFLGLSFGSWVSMLLPMLFAGAVFIVTWYFSVKEQMNARPTGGAIETTIERAMNGHEARGEHPRIDARLSAVESEQRVIRESQIRQEQLGKVQTELLKDIQGEVKQIRRGR